MPSKWEAVGLERIQDAGYKPAEPFPGSLKDSWLIECIECGHQTRRVARHLEPCKHPERQRAAEQEEKERKRALWAAEVAERDYLQAIKAMRLQKAATKNLFPLTEYPGEGKLWWVMCKFCRRAWQMPEDNLRACPHKGAGQEGHPPLPRIM